jgi:hypothetical protein
MKRATIAIIRIREAFNGPHPLDRRDARQMRAELYARQLGEPYADIYNLISRIARDAEREAGRV